MGEKTPDAKPEVKTPEVNTGVAPDTNKPNRNDAIVAQLEEAKINNARLMKQISDNEEAQNVKAKDFEKLWRNEQERSKTYEKKIDNLTQENKNNRDVFFTGLKQSAVETAAHKAGIDKDYMKFLTNESFKGVDVETTSMGKVNVLGASEFVETFKKENPRLFKDNADPNINLGGGNGSPVGDGKLTASEILKLQKENPAKYAEVMKDYGKYLKR